MHTELEGQETMGMTDAYRWAARELGTVAVRDQRVADRLVETLATFVENPGKTIPQACGSWGKTKAAYRLMDNDSVSSKAIMDSHREKTISRMLSHSTALAIQDTTCVSSDSPPNSDGDIGLCSPSEYRKGVLVHSTLAVTTEGIPLGLLDQQVWTRDPEETGKSKCPKRRSIEDKESAKWLQALDRSLQGVPDHVTVVTVCDREADIYEFVSKAMIEKKPILIRAAHNRRVLEEQKALFTLVESAPESGKILVDIPRDTRNTLPARQATLAVRYLQATLWPTLQKAKITMNEPVYVVHARELEPPAGVKGIEWLLLTTIPITSLDDAVEKINWYTLRWRIERFHYVLKSGCGIEELQFQTVGRLAKAIALYSIVAWRILWLTYQARETPRASCATILESYEWQALYCMVNKTSTPPETPPTLDEAIALIGRLGGHLGRKGDGKPGVKTLWRGLQRLKDITETMLLMRQMHILTIDTGNV